MKTVLVIDVPNELEGCTVIADCKLHRVYGKEGNYYLEKKDSFIGNRNGIYLRPFPSFKAVDLNDTRDVMMFCHGWNACLDEIAGEEEMENY